MKPELRWVNREMIMKMYNKGYTAAQIADVAEMDEKKDKKIS